MCSTNVILRTFDIDSWPKRVMCPSYRVTMKAGSTLLQSMVPK